MATEPTDAELWRGVEATIRTVLIPAIADDWARIAAVQLAGLAHLATTRPPDPTPTRVAELAAALDGLSGNPAVDDHWSSSSDDPAVVLGAVGRVLAAVVAADDASSVAVRSTLHSIVSRHLDEDLAVTGPLMAYFRGQLPDA